MPCLFCKFLYSRVEEPAAAKSINFIKFDVARIKIFGYPVRVQHRVKMKLHDKQLLR